MILHHLSWCLIHLNVHFLLSSLSVLQWIIHLKDTNFHLKWKHFDSNLSLFFILLFEVGWFFFVFISLHWFYLRDHLALKEIQRNHSLKLLILSPHQVLKLKNDDLLEFLEFVEHALFVILFDKNLQRKV